MIMCIQLQIHSLLVKDMSGYKVSNEALSYNDFVMRLIAVEPDLLSTLCMPVLTLGFVPSGAEVPSSEPGTPV